MVMIIDGRLRQREMALRKQERSKAQEMEKKLKELAELRGRHVGPHTAHTHKFVSFTHPTCTHVLDT